jgi:hypothetical protein
MEYTYDFSIPGTITAESEDEARELIRRRLANGPRGMGEPVYLDTSDLVLWEVLP